MIHGKGKQGADLERECQCLQVEVLHWSRLAGKKERQIQVLLDANRKLSRIVREVPGVLQAVLQSEKTQARVDGSARVRRTGSTARGHRVPRSND